MVKRIKKRIERPEDETAEGGPLEAEAPAVAGDFAAELAAADDDEFTRKTASAFKWVVDRRGLLIGVTAVVLVGIGIYLYTHRQKAAGSEEATASFMVGAEAYEKYIEGILGEGAQAAPADDLSGRLEKAGSAFAATRASYPESGLAQLATIGLAGTQLELGKYDEALQNYQGVTTDANADPMLKAVALQGKAAALDSKGDHAGAIEAWQAVEALNRDVFGLMANLEIARLQESLGKPAEAKAIYEKVQKDYAEALESFTNRGYKSDIERGLARLAPAS